VNSVLNPPAFLTPAELAARLGVSEAWVQLASWTLPCCRRMRDGKVWGIRVDDLQTWEDAANRIEHVNSLSPGAPHSLRSIRPRGREGAGSP
jgi:hypothetical protein